MKASLFYFGVTRAEVRKRVPPNHIVAKVEGGFVVFKTMQDYGAWYRAKKSARNA